MYRIYINRKEIYYSKTLTGIRNQLKQHANINDYFDVIYHDEKNDSDECIMFGQVKYYDEILFKYNQYLKRLRQYIEVNIKDKSCIELKREILDLEEKRKRK